MTRSRLWWIAFLGFQVFALLGVAWSIGCEWVEDPPAWLATVKNKSYHVSVGVYRGYPFPWRGTAHQYSRADGITPLDHTVRVENVALPVVIALVGLCVPWVVFTLRMQRSPMRITRWLRSIGLAAIATLSFSLFDIVTSDLSELQDGYEASPLWEPLLKNEHVNGALSRLRSKRRKEWGDTWDIDPLRLLAWQSRTLAARTGCFFLGAMGLCLLAYRPWRCLPAETPQPEPAS